jgi:hypothetical protein
MNNELIYETTINTSTLQHYIGYLFILIAICHEFAWWLAYKKYKIFPHDILPFPSKYDPDNWAIGLQVLID